jgi:putative hemolysin
MYNAIQLMLEKAKPPRGICNCWFKDMLLALRPWQAGYTDNGKVIDQTEYFRYQVFSGLLWYEIDGKEMAEATFHLQIKGTS